MNKIYTRTEALWLIDQISLSITEMKANLFTAQKACFQVAYHHRDLVPLTRLVELLAQKNSFTNGQRLLMFAMQEIGQADREGKNGVFTWDNKNGFSYTIKGGSLTEDRFIKSQAVAFYDWGKEPTLGFTKFDKIISAVKSVEKGRLGLSKTPLDGADVSDPRKMRALSRILEVLQDEGFDIAL